LSPEEEIDLVAALRAGDESAFATLVDRYHASMLRLARLFVRDRSIAEEIVQEAWLGVVRGIGRFEERSSLKTWIFRILVITAKARARHERRGVTLSELGDAAFDQGDPAVEPQRFRPPGAHWAGGWVSFPLSWGEAPEERLLARETLKSIRDAIDALPPSQRTVVQLHDVEGWTAEEIRKILQISEGNQRVLLHRGRSKVRRALERYLTGF
jgi:RNA polymerase sigma-70 factor, ECF subfamily